MSEVYPETPLGSPLPDRPFRDRIGGQSAIRLSADAPASKPPMTALPPTAREAAGPSPELAAAMAETRAVRDGYQELCEEFGPSPQSGWSARISLTVLNRHQVRAGLPSLPRTPAGDREDTTMRYRRERDEARADLATAIGMQHADRAALQAHDDVLTAVRHELRAATGLPALGDLAVHVRDLTAERDRLLAANERWAATLRDVQQQHARLTAENDALATSHGNIHDRAAALEHDWNAARDLQLRYRAALEAIERDSTDLGARQHAHDTLEPQP